MMKKKARFKIHVKTGDMVKLISGYHKGSIGKIIKVFPKTSQIIVENLNRKTKHIKPNNNDESGKIINFDAPIHSSNVMLYSKQYKISSRFHIKIDENKKKYRILNKTQEII